MMLHVKVVQLEFQDLGAKTAPAPGKDSMVITSCGTACLSCLGAGKGSTMKSYCLALQRGEDVKDLQP